MPLAGCRVLITRPEHDAAELAGRIRALGGVPVVVPLIALVPPRDPQLVHELDDALTRLDRCAWVVFTSRNAVAFTMERLRALGLGWPQGVLVAAVGRGTAGSLAEVGVHVDLVPDEARWQGLARALPRVARPGDRVLLPRSARAGDELPRALRAAGLKVHDVIAYDTVTAPDAADRLRGAAAEGPLDAVVLTSASAVDELAAALGEAGMTLEDLGEGRGRPLVACIGPNTADHARRAGFKVDVAPDRPGLAEVLAALARAFTGGTVSGSGDGRRGEGLPPAGEPARD